MFSGIVEELGELKRISRRRNVSLFEVRAERVLEDTHIGDSISVNGTCLTVTGKEKGILEFEVMPQTLKATNLGDLKINDKINLERALKMGGRIGGHFVTGHIDTAGIIRSRNCANASVCFHIAIPVKFMEFVLPRGSIAVDGISLTIADKRSGTFSVFIIPHTLKNTTLGLKGPGNKVNIEFDILAKKIAKTPAGLTSPPAC